MRVVVRIIAASILMLACAPAAAPPIDEDAIRSDVTALVQRWSDAGETGDWAAIADTYADAEGFAWIERGEVRYPDNAAILAGLESARASNARIINDVADIVVTPLAADAAAYHASYTLTVSTDQFSFTSSGVLSGVAIRQGDTWRFLQGSFSDRQAEAAAP